MVFLLFNPLYYAFCDGNCVFLFVEKGSNIRHIRCALRNGLRNGYVLLLYKLKAQSGRNNSGDEFAGGRGCDCMHKACGENFFAELF